jgi:hypothetical protein
MTGLWILTGVALLFGVSATYNEWLLRKRVRDLEIKVGTLNQFAHEQTLRSPAPLSTSR